MKKSFLQNKINSFIYYFFLIYPLIKFLCAYLIAVILDLISRRRKVWIILERGIDAQDNALHFFMYIKKHHPEISAMYAIKKNSPDIINLEGYNNSLLNYGSILYYINLIRSYAIISTHYHTYFPSLFLADRIQQSFMKIEAKQIFLQHGITKDLLKGLCAPMCKLDLFICGAKPEYDYVLRNFNHSQGVVKYTGLARFDTLNDVVKRKQILVMPTWRAGYIGYSLTEFLQSDFYKSYMNLLRDKALSLFLEEFDYTLLYYNHYEFQKYNEAFIPFSTDRIKIINFGNVTVQQLLKESALLITDYSSVFFDFAYMKKPVLYFHFDYEYYRSTQYSEGYFNYSTMGFGSVHEDLMSLIESLYRSLMEGCMMDAYYLNRLNAFFPLNDRSNCERIYNEIKNLK